MNLILQKYSALPTQPHSAMEEMRRMELEARDISPNFIRATPAERRAIQLILKHEATPEAIREFTRQQRKLGDYAYWYMLGTLWVSYTGFSDLALWRRLFSSPRALRETSLMKPSEWHALQAAPPEIPVYRAHRPGEADWFAFTLNPQTAARFATERGVAEVHKYTARREDIFALFLRRGEDEVLVLEKERLTPAGVIPILPAGTGN
jgi:hypothetical protein